MAPSANVKAGDKYTLDWGPVTVHPSEENTQCIWLKLSNASAIKVHQIHNTLGSASHGGRATPSFSRSITSYRRSPSTRWRKR